MTNLYFDVLLAQANQEIAKTNKGVNEKLVEITQERFALGKTSKDELLQIEMSLKNALVTVDKFITVEMCIKSQKAFDW